MHSHREIAEAAGTVTTEQSEALLCLHFVQEEENFFVLAPAAPADPRAR